MIARRSLGRSIERFEIGRYWSDDTGSRLISRSRPADAPDAHPLPRRSIGVPRPRTPRVDPESGVRVGPPIVCVRRRDRRQKPLRTCQVEPEHVSAPMVGHPAKLPSGITESIRRQLERFARRRTIRYRPHETDLSAREMSRCHLAQGEEIRQAGSRRSVRTSTSSKADPCG